MAAQSTQALVGASALRSALSIAAPIADSSSPMDVLSCVLLTIASDQIEVRTTNIQSDMRVSLPGQGGLDGALLLPLDSLRALLSGIDGEVSLSPGEGRGIEVKYGSENGSLSLAGRDPESFPTRLESEPLATFECDSDALGQAAAFSLQGTSSSSSRFDHDGCLLDISGGQAWIVATDGNRVHRAGLPGVSVDGEFQEIVSFAALQAVSGQAKTASRCRVSIGDRSTSFRWASDEMTVELVSTSLEGQFPAWRRAISLTGTGSSEPITVPVAPVSSFLKRSKVFRSGKDSLAHAQIATGDQGLEVSSRSELGEIFERFPDLVSSQAQRHNFRSEYLLAALGNRDSSPLELSFSGRGAAILESPNDNLQRLAVVMPCAL